MNEEILETEETKVDAETLETASEEQQETINAETDTIEKSQEQGQEVDIDYDKEINEFFAEATPDVEQPEKVDNPYGEIGQYIESDPYLKELIELKKKFPDKATNELIATLQPTDPSTISNNDLYTEYLQKQLDAKKITQEQFSTSKDVFEKMPVDEQLAKIQRMELREMKAREYETKRSQFENDEANRIRKAQEAEKKAIADLEAEMAKVKQKGWYGLEFTQEVEKQVKDHMAKGGSYVVNEKGFDPQATVTLAIAQTQLQKLVKFHTDNAMKKQKIKLLEQRHKPDLGISGTQTQAPSNNAFKQALKEYRDQNK